MKTKIYFLSVLLLFTTVTIAQNGINYKALIKDANGNVVANDLIQVQFNILQGISQTNVYSETHSPTTGANGLVLLNIGEGTPISGVFNDIDWANDNHYLNVQVNTGSGLVDMGTTEFKAVPYAIMSEKAKNVEGLSQLDQGNGIGWRIPNRGIPEEYGDIGLNAVDLSFCTDGLIPRGAMGNLSTAMGNHTMALGEYSTTMGNITRADGKASIAMGRATSALGDFSAALGNVNWARAYASMAIGRYNLAAEGDPENWIETDPLFEIGNGTSSSNRSNALTVYKNGTHVISSSGTGLRINTASTGISINNAGADGAYFAYPNNDGVVVFHAGNHGARLIGLQSGVYASSSNNGNPDVILGGYLSNEASDNGILASNLELSSSDIFIRSNDAVVINLDHNNDEAGQFLIRNGTNNTVFQVDESGNISHDGTITSSSDKRLKKDISDLSYGLNEVLQLQPKQYFWKDKAQTKKSLGLIAQDVQSVINEIVNIQDDEMQTLGVSYTELIPVLINAIQEQQEIINSQQQENNLQKTELAELQQSYHSLLSRIEILESNITN